MKLTTGNNHALHMTLKTNFHILRIQIKALLGYNVINSLKGLLSAVHSSLSSSITFQKS